jgi:hypothetical protein
MKFNVIVTCSATTKTLFALKNKSLITGYGDEIVGGYQLMFDMIVKYEQFDEYYDIMRRVETKITKYMQNKFNLCTKDIVKVSTSADWDTWEKKTNKNYEESMYLSFGYENGKFIMKGYEEQEKMLENLGIDINMLGYISYQAFNILNVD